ncbi:MAG: hypothetical protein HRU15_05980 [Planctomycetes bacterium]|nr:hypothetical protein [Planctomycetota bacterium]
MLKTDSLQAFQHDNLHLSHLHYDKNKHTWEIVFFNKAHDEIICKNARITALTEEAKG